MARAATQRNCSRPAPGDLFGRSVAVDGATLVVGSPMSLRTAGSAYVFARSNDEWMQQAKLTDFGTAVVDRFGFAVDIEGHHIVVGLPYDTAAGLATGVVQLFTREGGRGRASSSWSRAKGTAATSSAARWRSRSARRVRRAVR